MKSHLSSELFCETAVDRASVLSPGILGCVAGGIIFPQLRARGSGGVLKLINGDKWSWECDGPEAKDINNASRHCSSLPSSTLFFNLMFYCPHCDR